MKKHYLIKKTISIFLLVILIALTPVTGLVKGFTVFVYAANYDIMKSSAQVLTGLAGYSAYHYYQSKNTLSSIDLNDYIADVNVNYDSYYDKLSDQAKFTCAKLFTSMSNAEINLALQVAYSDNTIEAFGIDDLKFKILNNEPLSIRDMQRLGINDITANYLKDGLYANKSFYGSTDLSFDGTPVYIKNVSGINIRFQDQTKKTDVIWNYIPGLVKGSQHFTLNYYSSYLASVSTYWLNIDNQLYKIEKLFNLGRQIDLDVSKNLELKSTTLAGSSAVRDYNIYMNQYIKLSSASGSTWNVIYNSTGKAFSADIKRGLLNALATATGYDFSTTALYISNYSIDYYFDNTFEGDNINVGNPDKAFELLAPTAGVLNEYSATDSSDYIANKVIANINAQGQDVIDLAFELRTYLNEQTGKQEVAIGAVDGSIPVTDTGAVAVDFPDVSGDIGEGWLSIPILGSILQALKAIWELIKAFYNAVVNYFTNSASAVDEGIDWGNFKGLFDIFYIFYYLIIIVIMILLKFLAVVFNMLSIPPNSSLFANYPTMLSGLNYIKNIKVGGFNITLQQIFEYMFTVFFFLFIVTTLQKLYHSFAGIERQTINQEQKWDSNSNVIYRDGNYVNTKTGEIQDYKYK